MCIGVSVSCRYSYSCVRYLYVADRLSWFGKRELIFLQSYTCNYVVPPLPLGAWDRLHYILWHTLGLPYNYFGTASKELLSA